MIKRRVTIPFEQAVYGSFPFWDKGYGVLSASPGFGADWLGEFRGLCQRFGERPGQVAPSRVRGLFATRLTGGRRPWLVVGAGSPGSDDHGRPGALAFHALLIRPGDYRRTRYDPFALAPSLRNDWSALVRELPADVLTIDRRLAALAALALALEPDSQADAAAQSLARGQRVVLESPEPIDLLARRVWARLPLRVRRRVSVATWAFGDGNRFDLVALPRC